MKPSLTAPRKRWYQLLKVQAWWMYGEENGNFQIRNLCEKIYECSSKVTQLGPCAAARLRSPLCNSRLEDCLTQEKNNSPKLPPKLEILYNYPSVILCQSDRNRLRKGEFVVPLKENPLENKGAKFGISHTLRKILRERTRTSNHYDFHETIFHEQPLVLRAHIDNTCSC